MKLFIISMILMTVSIGFGRCSEEDEPRWRWDGNITETLEANAVEPLNIENYAGNTQNVHPKVLYFEQGWNGYEFWMAYTPYPHGRVMYENPSLAVSHDGINWDVPPGVTNPLIEQPDCGFNSDTHLVYDKEKDRMELWYRPYDNHLYRDKWDRLVSRDGRNWSEPEEVIPWGKSNELRMSASVWIEKGTYKMIFCDSKNLYLTLSGGEVDGWKWTQPELIEVDWEELTPWHLDAIYDEVEGTIKMVVCAYGPDGHFEAADLYYIESDETLKTTSSPTLILERGPYKVNFDFQSIYRASLVKARGLYYLYYSGIDAWKGRHIGLSIGDSPLTLKGMGR